MEKEKQEDANANNAKEPEEKSVKQAEKEVAQTAPKEVKESSEHDLYQTPLMTQKFNSGTDYGNELFDPRMRMMSEEDENKPLEAYGVMGVKSKQWRRTFKNQADFEQWLDKQEGNVKVLGSRVLEMNEANAFRDWSPRSVDDISPTEIALNKAVKMLRAGQKIEDIAGNVGMPVARLQSLLKPYLSKASPVVNKQDKYAAMASKYGVNENIKNFDINDLELEMIDNFESLSDQSNEVDYTFDIKLGDKKVGELKFKTDPFRSITGNLYGKPLPKEVNDYASKNIKYVNNPSVTLKNFLKSNRGEKWLSNIHKYANLNGLIDDYRSKTKNVMESDILRLKKLSGLK
jgi:hypothetical protein